MNMIDPDLNYHPEFPLRTPRSKQSVQHYYTVEHYFMPTEDYLQSHRKMLIRKHAIRTISKYTVGEGYKAFIPYIALNHFDRFLSTQTLPNSEKDDEENARLTAICCFMMATKLCMTKNFNLESFLRRHDIEIPTEKLQSLEFKIQQALKWRGCSVTPFCFLNTLYPRFKNLGGFSRRSIHQIIVNSLGEESFTKYKPSLIAQSSLLAAAHILYGSERLHVTEDEVTPCFREMIELCIRKKIEMEAASVDGDDRDEKSELYPWTKRPKNVLEYSIEEEKEKGPDRDWDFDAQWLPTN